MVDWALELSGDKDFLERLRTRYSDSGINIVIRDGKYFLRSEHFRGEEDRVRVQSTGDDTVEFINSSAHAYSYKHDPVSAAGYWKIANDDSWERDFVAIGCVSGQLLLTVTDSQPAPDYWHRLWQMDSRVRHVLNLFRAIPQSNWFSLFMIYEAIVNDPCFSDGEKGRRKNAERRIKAWTSKSETDSFCTTANKNRHSPYNGQEAHKTRDMTLSEANNFIRLVICKWLEEKGKTRS